jgi:uncharacterized cupin superfamily protein
MANVFEPDFDAEQERPGYRWRRARLGWQAGAARLGASLFELPPGEASFPLHYHLANEELLIVLAGRPVLRSTDGERELSPGEVVAFPVGERGAHQIINSDTEPARVLIVSEMNAPEVLVYPESGKVAARERAPGSRESGRFQTFRQEDAVDYFEGEEREPGR